MSACLGAALSGLRYNTALVDLNMGLRSLDMLLGMENDVVYDLSDLANDICLPKQALLPVPGAAGLQMLSASQWEGPSSLPREAYERVLSRLLQNHRYLVLDGPPGADWGFMTAVSLADRAAVVTKMDPLSLRGAERMVMMCRDGGVKDVYLIINGAEPETADEEGEYPYMAVQRRMDAPVIGFVPETAELGAMPIRLPLSAGLGRTFEDMARRMYGDRMPLRPPTKPQKQKRSRFALTEDEDD